MSSVRIQLVAAGGHKASPLQKPHRPTNNPHEQAARGKLRRSAAKPKQSDSIPQWKYQAIRLVDWVSRGITTRHGGERHCTHCNSQHHVAALRHRQECLADEVPRCPCSNRCTIGLSTLVHCGPHRQLLQLLPVTGTCCTPWRHAARNQCQHVHNVTLNGNKCPAVSAGLSPKGNRCRHTMKTCYQPCNHHNAATRAKHLAKSSSIFFSPRNDVQ